MKGFFKFLILVLGLGYIVCFLFDRFKGGNDGIINNIYFHRIFLRIIPVFSILGLGNYFATNGKGLLKNVLFQINIIIYFVVFLEILAFLFLRISKHEAYIPNHLIFYNNVPLGVSMEDKRAKYYGDVNADFGRWRVPNSATKKERCSDKKSIVYTSNNLGARDLNRTNANSSRVITLGDSFIEGTLVNESDRFTNLLEDKSGIEHLNFGIIGANPLVEYLTLKSVIKPNVAFDKLMLGLLPANDFETHVPSAGAMYTYPIYRPFLANENEEIKYSLASYRHSLESIEALQNSTVLRQTRDSLYASSTIWDKLKIEVETNSYLFGFIKYKLIHGDKSDLDRYPLNFEKPPLNTAYSREFEFALHKLLKENKSKKVLIVIFPLMNDLKAYKRNKINVFTPYLKQLLKNYRIEYIDLMEDIAHKTDSIEELYILCDGHFNDKGNALCAELISNNPAYKRFMAQ